MKTIKSFFKSLFVRFTSWLFSWIAFFWMDRKLKSSGGLTTSEISILESIEL